MSSRSATSSGAKPSRSRAEIRSSSRRLNRRRPSCRASVLPRHSSVSIASSTQLGARLLGRHQRRRRRGCRRTPGDGGARHRPLGSIRGAARALGGARRVPERGGERRTNGPGPRRVGAAAAARGRDRASPRASSRMTGSSCCMSCERRVRPNASSRRAARVRSTSMKPNAARRSSAAPGDKGPGTRERVEQRREEQPLVDRAHRRLVGPVVGLELLRARSARA